MRRFASAMLALVAGTTFAADDVAPPKVQPTLTFSSNRFGAFELMNVGVDGKHPERLVREGDDRIVAHEPTWSSGGKRVVFASWRDNRSQIHLMDPRGHGLRALTDTQAVESKPTCSPDGRKVAFCSTRDGNEEIYLMDADGSHQVNLTKDPARDTDPTWTPDGKSVVFASDRNGQFRLWAVNADGKDPREVVHRDLFGWIYPTFSPDGKRPGLRGRLARQLVPDFRPRRRRGGPRAAHPRGPDQLVRLVVARRPLSRLCPLRGVPPGLPAGQPLRRDGGRRRPDGLRLRGEDARRHFGRRPPPLGPPPLLEARPESQALRPLNGIGPLISASRRGRSGRPDRAPEVSRAPIPQQEIDTVSRRMTILALAAIPALLALAGVAGLAKEIERAKTVLDFKVKDIDGKEVDLSKYKGEVLLIVNTASKCGLTPQYEALESLYEAHKSKGFAVLAFPANEFKGQEPGTNAEIKEFCTTKYNVTFPVFSKIVVKGDGMHPLYQYLTAKDTDPDYAGEIPWNFTKFLVNRKGQIVARFDPKVTPDSPEVTKAIEAALAEGK